MLLNNSNFATARPFNNEELDEFVDQQKNVDTKMTASDLKRWCFSINERKKMWSTPQIEQRCPVKKYIQKRPPQMCKIDSPFYLAVNYDPSSTNEFWYKQQRMGKDRISSIMKRMGNTAEISGGKTNHSVRKTMVTALTKHNVPETQIIQLTGHKHLQSLNAYKKASMDQQKDITYSH